MKCKGFSLSEMIIVIVIIAILLAIGIPAYLASVRRAEVKNVANGLADMLSMLYEYLINTLSKSITILCQIR